MKIQTILRVFLTFFMFLVANNVMNAQGQDETGGTNPYDPNYDFDNNGIIDDFEQSYKDSNHLDEIILYGTNYANGYYGSWFWFLDDYNDGNIGDLETYYDFNFSNNSLDGYSYSGNLPPVPAEFKRIFSAPYSNNITIAIPVKKVTVSGVSTLVAASIAIMVTAMPTTDLTALVNLYNSATSSSLSATSATVEFANKANGGNLSTQYALLEIWLQQFVIDFIFDESVEFDNIEFDDCTGGCHCNTSACGITWYLDKDNDGYHEPGSPRSQPNNPGYSGDGWKQGTSLGEDCDDNDPSKWNAYDRNFNFVNFDLSDGIIELGTGGPVTPSTPSISDDSVYGGGSSGLPITQPTANNLVAFTAAKSGETNLNGLNPFSDDEYWVTENLLEKTEAQLFDYFENALELLTTGSTANEALDLLLDHFKNGSGETYYNDVLSSIINFSDGDASEGRSVGQFMNSLFTLICNSLAQLEGQCIGEINIDLTSLMYPNFPLSDPNLIAQLGGIQGVGVFIDEDLNLTANLYDTFGVSEDDAVKRDGLFGNTISGGSIGTKAMRILQTHHGYQPFVHVVKIDPFALGYSNFNIDNCE